MALWPILRRILIRRVPKHSWAPLIRELAAAETSNPVVVNIDDRVHVYRRWPQRPTYYVQVVAHTKGASHGEHFTAETRDELVDILTAVLDPPRRRRAP